MKKLFSNQHGVSLIEVMVAAGISSVIALGTMKINETSQKGMRNVATKADLSNYVNFKLGSALSDSNVCVNSFDVNGDGATGDIISLAVNGAEPGIDKIEVGVAPNVVTLAEVGEVLPSTNSEFTVDLITLRRDTTTSCTLTLDLSRNNADRKIGGKHKREEIALGCGFDDTGSNNLETCSTKGASELGRWTYISGTVPFLQNEIGAASVGTYNGGGGLAYPAPRLIVTQDDLNTSNWNGLEDAIGLPDNYVLRWGANNATDVGVAVYGESNDCIHLKAGANAPHVSACQSSGTSITGGATISGDATINNNLTVSNNITSTAGNIAASGGNVTASNNVVAGNILSGANVRVNGGTPQGTLWVNGTATVNSIIHGNNRGIFSSLTVNGAAWGQSWNVFSDRRFKTNIEPLRDPLAKILELEPVQYDFAQPEQFGNDHSKQLGLIAQDVQKVYPEIVKEREGYFAVNYTALIAPIIDSIREIYNMVTGNGEEIAEAKREIASLKKENEELKARLDRIEKALEQK